MGVTKTQVVKFIRKGDKGDAGENGITISLLPAALTPKVGVSSTLRVQVALYDGGRLIGYNDKTDGNMLCSTLPSSSAYRWTFRVESGKFYFVIMLTPTNTTAISLPFTITYKGAKYDSVITIQPVADGAQGKQGATLRGPQAWSDCANGYSFQAGGDGDSWKDVVIYKDNYYSCIKSHTKTADNYPGSTAANNNKYWQLGDKVELVASKILLATYALVKNLGVEAIDMKDASGNIVFQAKDGNVVCNSGTFNNITVKSNSTLEGIVKAQLYYSPTKTVTTATNRTYVIDPIAEPCCSFLINEPTNKRFIQLPNASLYDGLEIQVFTRISGRWNTDKMTFVRTAGTESLFVKANSHAIEWNSSIKNYDAVVNNYQAEYKDYGDTTIYMCPNCVCKFKSINGAWYAIEGLYTGE
mgnify:FL=1